MPEKPYHHGDLRNGLIDAALALLKEGPIESVSLREIAKRAGVSANAPYRHFPDKEHLLVAVAERGFKALVARFRAAETEGQPISLEKIGRAYFEFAHEFPAEYAVMFGRGDCLDENLATASGEAFFILVQAIKVLMPKGTTQTEAVPNALMAWSMIHGYAHLSLQSAFHFIDPSVVPSPEQLFEMIALAIQTKTQTSKMDA